MRRNIRGVILILLSVVSPVLASAQLDDDPFRDGDERDPLAVDRDDQLENVTPTTAGEVVRAPLPVVRGEALSTVAGVRETEHEVDVTLRDGLAQVEERMRFVSNARAPAEIHYRLPVPEDAALSGLTVCRGEACREGIEDPSAGPMSSYDYVVLGGGRGADLALAAHAAPIRDARGTAFLIRAAPIGALPHERTHDALATLDVTVRYLVSAPVRAGHVRLILPARGRDNRVVAAQYRVRSDELSRGAVDGRDAVEEPVQRAPWEDAEITARLDLRDVAYQALEVPCGTQRCARVRAVAGVQAARARQVFLVLDASPSMAGPAAGRMGPTIAALLSTLPSTSRVQAVVFASRANRVGSEAVSPTELSVSTLEAARESSLGNGTQFSAAWEVIASQLTRSRAPLIVVIGDGGMTADAANRRAFQEAVRRGAEVAIVDLADRPVTPALREATAGLPVQILEVGMDAARAAMNHGAAALAERLSVLSAEPIERDVIATLGNRRVSLGPLLAGEEVVLETVIGARERVQIGSVRASRGPTDLALGLAGHIGRANGRSEGLRLVAVPESTPTPAQCSMVRTDPAQPAYQRIEVIDPVRCDVPAPRPTVANRRPSELGRDPLLDLMRQRIIPIARGCFRSDRRGRADHQSRAVLEFRLADREVSGVSIRGRIAEELRSCLATSLESLEIPRFDGSIAVRYPLYTAAHLPPPTLTLDTDVADVVDAVSADAP